MFRAIILAGALAGLIVAILLTAVQQVSTVPLILQAEVYEEAQAHTHDGHEHEEAGWQPSDGFERTAYTALFNLIEWVGYGFLLAGAIALSRRTIGWREGFLWGLAGFLCVTVAPGLGLPPELPGIPAAALEPRQLWWVCAALATALGLWLIAFRPAPWAAVLAIAVIAAPHLIGAPRLENVETNVPEALSHRFTVSVTLVTLMSWSLLGGLTGYLQQRLTRSA